MSIRMDTRDGMEETYADAVLQTWEHNGYNDSDWFAAVWDEAEQRDRRRHPGSARQGRGMAG